MGRNKSNKHIKISKDIKKSYVYIDEGKKSIGILMWHYEKKKWFFSDSQPRVFINNSKEGKDE